MNRAVFFKTLAGMVCLPLAMNGKQEPAVSDKLRDYGSGFHWGGTVKSDKCFGYVLDFEDEETVKVLI